MSTYYFAPMKQNLFVEIAKELGWSEDQSGDGEFALVSPNGHLCQCIREHTVRHEEHYCSYTFFIRFGTNYDVSDLAEEVGAYDEHSEHFDIVWSAVCRADELDSA